MNDIYAQCSALCSFLAACGVAMWSRAKGRAHTVFFTRLNPKIMCPFQFCLLNACMKSDSCCGLNAFIVIKVPFCDFIQNMHQELSQNPTIFNVTSWIAWVDGRIVIDQAFDVQSVIFSIFFEKFFAKILSIYLFYFLQL